MKIQPITRKERFLYEIVGWGETAPKNELTTEELFFAKILGRNVTLPDLSNVPRYYLFLAKIAGENVNISPPTYVSPPLEFFLTRAAGMDVETPAPRTREEIFWAAYMGVETEIEGIPPLTFTAKAGTLSNYRIYGNTVNGESVGDRTANLFANVWKKRYIRADNGLEEQIDGFICSGFFPVEYGQTYSISRNINVGYDNIRGYRDDKSFIGTGTEVCNVGNPFPSGATKIGTFTVTNENVAFVRFNDSANDLGMKYMIVDGTYTEQTMPAYEPYGYRVPVTVNSNTTNIYLDEQLVKSGDDADYIDYVMQKRYNADGTSQSVELPALQTIDGTNTLSVETTVQPSKVMIKTGKFGTHKVRYYDSDGTFLSAEDVKDGTNAQGFTPTKASTVQYNYAFMGWSTTKGSTIAETGVLNDITADKSLYAVFSQSLRTFTVYFYNGNTLLQTVENVQYGGTATYTGEAPTKDGFTFSGWQPSNVNITADTSCYAQFVEG